MHVTTETTKAVIDDDLITIAQSSHGWCGSNTIHAQVQSTQHGNHANRVLETTVPSGLVSSCACGITTYSFSRVMITTNKTFIPTSVLYQPPTCTDRQHQTPLPCESWMICYRWSSAFQRRCLFVCLANRLDAQSQCSINQRALQHRYDA